MIASDVVARYAADAACEVEGVARIVEGVRKGMTHLPPGAVNVMVDEVDGAP